MRKFNFFCSFLIVLSLSLLIITMAQSIVLRSSAVYTFYFNDTRVVGQISGSYTNSEMSDEIAEFMNSWRPDGFQVYEDTGYDMQGLFDEKDSRNMLAVKRWADISIVLFLISLIISVAIYIYFLRNDFKVVLRKRLIPVSCLTAVLLGAETFVLKTKVGLSWIASAAGLLPLSDESALQILLGGDFISLAANFLMGITIVIYLVVLYGTLVLTKPPRIFF